MYQLITTNQQLNANCNVIKKSRFLAVDTEFIRRSTFYPKLGLIQISNAVNTFLIDPLQITNWQPLNEIISNNCIEKSFHAGSEDIEIFVQNLSIEPQNLIDSQIFAAFLDNNTSTSFANLVQKYLQITIDKSQTLTDWLRRSLSNTQLKYAAYDVIYLYPLIEELKQKLKENGWLGAAYEECSLFFNRRILQIKSDENYLKLKKKIKLDAKQQAYFYALAKWRLDIAKKKDRACNLILKEEQIIKLIKNNIKTRGDLADLRIDGKIIRLYGNEIIKIINDKFIEVKEEIKISTHKDYKELIEQVKKSAEQISKKNESKYGCFSFKKIN